MSEYNDRQLMRALSEIDDLRNEITVANAREREAFMAGFKAATTTPPGMFGRDEEQAWQQYRCQDETDWKVVSEEEAAKIDASVSTGRAPND